MKVVIIGAVAAGPKAACRIKRLEPGAKVLMVDADELVAYAGCGIPFYISGDVPELAGLVSTSFHMVRDPEFFKGAKGVDVLVRTKAVEILPGARKVVLEELATGRRWSEDYDKLVLATGSEPVIPPIPGVKARGVVPMANLHHARQVREALSSGELERAAIIGAGPTGLELAEALNEMWGVQVWVYEQASQPLPGLLDEEMGAMVANHLRSQEGLELVLGARVEMIEAGDDGRVKAVVTDRGRQEVDMVILAAGVRPNVALARAAGLEIAETGAIAVDEHMRTSDPDIFAAGDCVSPVSLITGQRVWMPSGSLANRQGRVVGTNVCGGKARFPGVVGSFCIKIFGLGVACAGLSEQAAADAGMDVVAPLVVQADRAHFHPDMALMYMKMVVERSSRRVVGIAALGTNADAVVGRVGAVAGLMAKGATLEDISNLELPYSPPLTAAMDILNATANTAENMIEGRLRAIGPAEFSRMLARRHEQEVAFVDVRAMANAAAYLKALAPHWVHFPQERLTSLIPELPRDKTLVLICNSGVRSYEAQVMLDAAGIHNTYNLAGGVAAVKMWGEPILPQGEEDG